MSYPGYMFHPYPRHVHKRGGVYRIVHSDAERDQAVAEGWALQPVPDAVDEPLVPASVSAPPVKRKPGRPKRGPVEEPTT